MALPVMRAMDGRMRMRVEELVKAEREIGEFLKWLHEDATGMEWRAAPRWMWEQSAEWGRAE